MSFFVYNRLLSRLKALSRAAVAFSGGTDSAFLLFAAREALGAENVLALTADSAFFPREEAKGARALAESLGIRQVTVSVDPLSDPLIRQNPPDRCYHCKKRLLSVLKQRAQAEGFPCLLRRQQRRRRGRLPARRKSGPRASNHKPIAGSRAYQGGNPRPF